MKNCKRITNLFAHQGRNSHFKGIVGKNNNTTTNRPNYIKREILNEYVIHYYSGILRFLIQEDLTLIR